MRIPQFLGRRTRAAITALAFWLGLGALPIGGLLLVAGPAHAVIGRPLTPVSYGGMARRTARRTSRRTSRRWAAASSTLPAGCVPAGGVYSCGGVTYEEAFDGGNVVYVVVEDDDD